MDFLKLGALTDGVPATETPGWLVSDEQYGTCQSLLCQEPYENQQTKLKKARHRKTDHPSELYSHGAHALLQTALAP